MTNDSTKQLLRQLPAVHDLLALPDVAAAGEPLPQTLRTAVARSLLDCIREDLATGREERWLSDGTVSRETLAAQLASLLREQTRPQIRRAVNATGVLLHTGLGRSLLPPAALEAVQRELSGYCTLEIDRASGERGNRQTGVSELLCRLTGAEAALVVNNNAAATMLALTTLARGREAVVSRGQLVEIGGSFRMPDIMSESGVRLVEVGTTNRTRIGDYERAVTENTGALVRVHTSNYRIYGFTEEVSLADLVSLGRSCALPVLDDLGSGALMDLASYGLRDEPLVRDSVRAGADLICFSTDKLIGGPQGGALIGKEEWVRRAASHPLTRAVRPDKFTLVALEATLRLFLDPERLALTHPLYQMLAAAPATLQTRAERLTAELRGRLPDADFAAVPATAQVGSGSLPTQALPSWALRWQPQAPVAEVAQALRLQDPPVFTRIHEDGIQFDMRSLSPEDDTAVVTAVCAAAEGTKCRCG